MHQLKHHASGLTKEHNALISAVLVCIKFNNIFSSFTVVYSVPMSYKILLTEKFGCNLICIVEAYIAAY